ncbi:unnamed protein product [Cyclocybe aegerita]|uniref:Uncharacterized protein n=1 Tax=Cyclocybe aegerita TaxID=1973307 RepID=A0A8S0X959_CYCAE|nr:unnamed protein product [Cyclocybe aegerita]
MSDLPPRGRGTRPPGSHPRGSGSAPPAVPPAVASTSSAAYSTVVPAQSCHTLPHRRSRSTTDSTHSSQYESDLGMAQPHQEMEVEGNQGGEEVLRDPSIDLLLGDLEVLTTSIAKATDWVLWAAHHDPLSIDGGDTFTAQMTAFVSAIMSTDFGRIHGQGDLADISLASMLEAETSSREEPTIHLAPVFRPPPPAAHGLLDEGASIGVSSDILMQALDDLSRLASPSRTPASLKCKGVNRLVPPPQKKSKVAYSCPGLPLLINCATKPKPHPTTWAGIAHQATLMPPLPPGLGLQ